MFYIRDCTNALEIAYNRRIDSSLIYYVNLLVYVLPLCTHYILNLTLLIQYIMHRPACPA